MKKQLNFIKIRQASLELFQKTEKERNNFLKSLSNTLKNNKTAILKANEKDIRQARQSKLSESFVQRLILDEKGLKNLRDKLKAIQKLKSGIGAVLEEKALENGILLKKVSVPLGVTLVIYEARPEVTIDVVALCIKSGNVAILKGGSEALHTNKALFQCILVALDEAQIQEEAVSIIEDRSSISKLLTQNEYIDLVIARGGYAMVKKIINKSKIPVLAHSSGGARIYVDKSAELSQATDILVNAKISKPAACNSLDTILIHKEVGDSFILGLVKLLERNNVVVLGDEYISKLANVKKTNAWKTEFLGLTVSIKKVNSVDEAIEFINLYTKKHSEGLIAKDKSVIKKFTMGIDAASVFVNCSTRFHDGYEFGLGSEMGIATGKLHARGPVGLKELTSYKWEAYGNGQIR